MKRIKIFGVWLFGHFALHFMFIPLAVKNVIPPRITGIIGYLDIFIFGVRIIRIQKTKPWSNEHE